MQKTKKVAKTSLNRARYTAKKVDPTIEILGTHILGTHKREVLAKLWLQRKELLHIATVNPEYIVERRDNPRFAEALSHCLTVADGWGVVWAHRILDIGSGERELERITGGELVEEILHHADRYGEKVFLLGAKPGVAALAAEAMSKKYPGARLSWWEGARSVRLEQSEEASMTNAKINAEEPDYLLVAYGSPWQDIWIEDNRPYLRVRVAIGVGGVLDEWAGVQRPAPAWIDTLGGKWLWRLLHEPRRWRRILRVFWFAILVWWEKVKVLF